MVLHWLYPRAIVSLALSRMCATAILEHILTNPKMQTGCNGHSVFCHQDHIQYQGHRAIWEAR